MVTATSKTKNSKVIEELGNITNQLELIDF